jgi:hypothetical protein
MYELLNVFESFLPQLLLYPNATDPLNGEAASLLIREPALYNLKVKGEAQRPREQFAAPRPLSSPAAHAPVAAPAPCDARCSCCRCRRRRAEYVWKYGLDASLDPDKPVQASTSDSMEDAQLSYLSDGSDSL